MRAPLIWAALTVAVAAPLAVAATSPLLAWREPVYIGAGFAGVLALALLPVQPLLAAGWLPGLSLRASRLAHRGVGAALAAAVVAHVAGLWITSPPDVVDALLFASPTPFAVWGVVAMWAVFAAAALAALRRRLRLPPRLWRRAHTALAGVIVGCTVAHAALIEGTMGAGSKAVASGLAVVALLKAVAELRSWGPVARRRTWSGDRDDGTVR